MVPYAKTQEVLSKRTRVIKSAWERIGADLEQERARIHQEIKSTPPPVPACDVHFNLLLEARARLCEELDQVRQAANDSVAPEEALKRLNQFLRSSHYVGDEAKQAIKSWLHEGSKEGERCG